MSIALLAAPMPSGVEHTGADEVQSGIAGNHPEQQVANIVAKHDVAKALVAMTAIEKVRKLTARSGDVRNHRLPTRARGGELRDDGANLIGNANVAGAALRGCELERRLAERRLVAFRMGLQQAA